MSITNPGCVCIGTNDTGAGHKNNTTITTGTECVRTYTNANVMQWSSDTIMKEG